MNLVTNVGGIGTRDGAEVPNADGDNANQSLCSGITPTFWHPNLRNLAIKLRVVVKLTSIMYIVPYPLKTTMFTN